MQNYVIKGLCAVSEQTNTNNEPKKVSLFREKSPGQLNPDQLKTLAGQLRRRFSADPHQISRVTGISYAELTKMLQDF